MAVIPAIFGRSDPILALIKQSSERKAAAALRLKFYHDQQCEELRAALARRWSKPDDFRLFQVNIVRKITDKRAMVYKAPPMRTFQGVNQDKMDTLYAAMRANVVLKKANRLTKLLKAAMIQVRWSGDRLALSVVTPNVLDVVYADPEDPSRAIVTHPDVDPPVANRDTGTTYSDWTALTYRRLDYRGQPLPLAGNPGNVNPYGVLPFVPLFDRHPDDVFFLPGGDDLIEAQMAVNVGLVNLWRAIELQSHGQAWASGIPASDVLKVGPDRAVTLPVEGKFGFAAPGTPIEEVLKGIEFVMKQTAMANDLSPAVFTLDPKAESAAAKVADTVDLIEARQDDIELWRNYETRLFGVVQVIWNVHRPDDPIPDKATLTVNFGELSRPLSETDRLETYQRRIDLGIWSPVDALLADDPDLGTREDALEELQKRREELAMLGPSLGGPGVNTL